MAYRVISTFMHRATDRYVAPGQPCPELDAETAARLIGAGCIEIAPAASPEQAPAPVSASADDDAPVAAPTRKGKRSRGS